MAHVRVGAEESAALEAGRAGLCEQVETAVGGLRERREGAAGLQPRDVVRASTLPHLVEHLRGVVDVLDLGVLAAVCRGN